VIGKEWSNFAEPSGELFPERCILLPKAKVLSHRFNEVGVRLQIVDVQP
jgi:hypothetical protein